MSVSAISSIMTNTTAVQSAKTTNSTSLEENDFMTLLLAQLKNQDPLKPMDSNEMMGQIAQLNSLKALESIQVSMAALNASTQISYASSLIGKTITAIPDINKPEEKITGVVTSMTMEDGVIMLKVGDKEVSVSSVVNVSSGE
jgi:flagellar basal-body rod modification protein FlgD